MRFPADAIDCSRILLGVYFFVYALLALVYPKPFTDFLIPFGASWALLPIMLLLMAASLLVCLNRRLVLGLVFIFGFMTIVEILDWCISDQLEWAYLGWLCAALTLLRYGVPRAKLLNLGWWVGGVTFSLQGLVKVFNTGADWISGKVMSNILAVLFPQFRHFLAQSGLLSAFCIALGFSTLFFHLSALPFAVFAKGRKFLFIMAVIFHMTIALTPLAYVSFGMMAFWIFLSDSFDWFKLWSKLWPKPTNGVLLMDTEN